MNISQLTFLAASHSRDDGSVDDFGVKREAASSALQEDNQIDDRHLFLKDYVQGDTAPSFL